MQKLALSGEKNVDNLGFSRFTRETSLLVYRGAPEPGGAGCVCFLHKRRA